MNILHLYLNFFILLLSFLLAVRSQQLDSFPYLESMFPKDSLIEAFEKYPLLSKISDKKQECTTEDIKTVSLSQDDTINVNGQLYRLQDVRRYQSGGLIQFNDLNQLLVQPEVNYKVVKKVIQDDGEEGLGVLDHEQVDDLLKVSAAFQLQFSLVVNRLHQQWKKISDITRKLEAETHFPRVSSNLYVTPPSSTAFESHWDFMDVIVVQISGKKFWNVAKNPTIYLSTEELKRKPTMEEVSEPYYPTFLLEPGDALYIPRGFLHNASTVELNDEPSLHLTFGLEPHTSCVEDLMKFTFDKEFHDTIQEMAKNIDNNENNVLRKSVPLYDSWRKIEDAKKLYEEAIQEISNVATVSKNSSKLVNACETAKNNSHKFEVAHKKLVEEFVDFRRMNHKRDSGFLQRAGFEV